MTLTGDGESICADPVSLFLPQSRVDAFLIECWGTLFQIQQLTDRWPTSFHKNSSQSALGQCVRQRPKTSTIKYPCPTARYWELPLRVYSIIHVTSGGENSMVKKCNVNQNLAYIKLQPYASYNSDWHITTRKSNGTPNIEWCQNVTRTAKRPTKAPPLWVFLILCHTEPLFFHLIQF